MLSHTAPPHMRKLRPISHWTDQNADFRRRRRGSETWPQGDDVHNITVLPVCHERVYSFGAGGRNDDPYGECQLNFVQEVRSEAGKVTWPSWKETYLTTMMVFIMVGLTMVFFAVVDFVLQYGEYFLIGARRT